MIFFTYKNNVVEICKILICCGEYSHWPCMIPCDTEDSQCKEHVFNPP